MANIHNTRRMSVIVEECLHPGVQERRFCDQIRDKTPYNKSIIIQRIAVAAAQELSSQAIYCPLPCRYFFRLVILKNSVSPSTVASTFMLTRGIFSNESSFMTATRAR